MSVDAFGNSPAMTFEEMIEDGLLDAEGELTEKGAALVGGEGPGSKTGPGEEEDTHHEVGNLPLTVGQLRKMLEGVADDTQVVMDDCRGWYANVETVIVPRADFCGEYAAVTFVAGEDIDARQF